LSLRPRYSLLTLLVLTALVAGGVKLWYGPHHVVERSSPEVEDKYTFTRDWRGNRIIQGPRIIRDYRAEGLAHVEIRYYRQGEELQWIYTCTVVPEESRLDIPAFHGSYHECPLEQNEIDEFQEAIRIERLPKLPVGKRRSEYQGFNFFRSPFDRSRS
jgi:hypothetical protein